MFVLVEAGQKQPRFHTHRRAKAKRHRYAPIAASPSLDHKGTLAKAQGCEALRNALRSEGRQNAGGTTGKPLWHTETKQLSRINLGMLVAILSLMRQVVPMVAVLLLAGFACGGAVEAPPDGSLDGGTGGGSSAGGNGASGGAGQDVEAGPGKGGTAGRGAAGGFSNDGAIDAEHDRASNDGDGDAGTFADDARDRGIADNPRDGGVADDPRDQDVADDPRDQDIADNPRDQDIAEDARDEGDGSSCPCIDPTAPDPPVYRTPLECFPISFPSYAPFARDPCFPLTMVAPPYYWGERVDSTYAAENLVAVTVTRSGTATTFYFDATTEGVVGASRSNWTPDPIYCSNTSRGGPFVSAGVVPTTAPTSRVQTCPREGGT